MKRYCEGVFGTSITTVNVNYLTKTVEFDGSRITLNLCDTMGTEKFFSISKNYIRKSDACLFIYDVTSINSFNQIEQWVNEYSESSDKSLSTSCILVGNKSDVKDEERIVSTQQGKDLAENYKMEFFECSALNGDNIDAIFQHAIKLIKSNSQEKEEEKPKAQEKKKQTVDIAPKPAEQTKEKSGCCHLL